MKRRLFVCLAMLTVFGVVLNGCKTTATTPILFSDSASASTSALTPIVIPTTTHVVGPIAYAITAGPDGNLWFTEADENKIGKISPVDGSITEYDIPTAMARPWGITAGPDGNLWFTEADGNKIGKISPAKGEITEFIIPTADAGPIGITAGTDGNLWFTEPQGNKIGKITPATGEITEYNIPTANSRPYDGITAGPDGNLWFTEPQGNKIGKITPATGEITEYNIPTVNAGPYGIAAGPDGHLWFTELNTNKIGKITPATGEITEYNIPTANSRPYDGITAGPDGNLWFTESSQNKIGKISPKDGSVTQYSLATTSATTTQSQQPIEVVSVFGPLQPFNPGGPSVEITLKNVSAEPVVSLTAVFTDLGPREFDFDFAVTSANPLLSGSTISNKLTLINGGFENNLPYLLIIQGTLLNGVTFNFTTQVEIVEPPNQ